MFINSNLSKNNKEPKTDFASTTDYVSFLSLIDSNSNFNELCRPDFRSKSTQTIIWKSIIPTFNKLEKVHINL